MGTFLHSRLYVRTNLAQSISLSSHTDEVQWGPLPDFSIMWNYPLHTQLESTCKSRTIGAWLQHCDIPVIPNVRWGDSRTYNFAFDGIEPGGTVAVGTVGCMREREARRVFTEGLAELVNRIHPSRIVVYGSLREDVFKVVRDAGIEIVHFPSATSVVMAVS